MSIAKPTIQFYQVEGGWRWRLIAINGRIMADSSSINDPFTRFRDCLRAMNRVLMAISVADVEVVEQCAS